jgi:hypothetical protein
MFVFVINAKNKVFTMFKNLNRKRKHIILVVKINHVEIELIFHWFIYHTLLNKYVKNWNKRELN